LSAENAKTKKLGIREIVNCSEGKRKETIERKKTKEKGEKESLNTKIHRFLF